MIIFFIQQKDHIGLVKMEKMMGHSSKSDDFLQNDHNFGVSYPVHEACDLTNRILTQTSMFLISLYLYYTPGTLSETQTYLTYFLQTECNLRSKKTPLCS